MRRGLRLALQIAGIAAVAWGALSFGAVYPWAYSTLAAGCAAIGLAALAVDPRGRPPLGALSIGLLLIGLAAAVQLVPLQLGTLERVSPATAAFLKQYDFSYGSTPHPLSIDPARTRLGLTLFACLALFFVGFTRLISTRGAAAIVRPLVTFGVVLALIGVVQQTLWGDTPTYLRKVYGFWQPRFRGDPFGPFINRNHFAGWMCMVLPLALAGAQAAWERGKGTTPRGLHGKLSWLSSSSAAGVQLMTFAAGIMGLSVLLTQSRSGMAAAGLGTMLFATIVIRRQSSRQAQAIAAFAAVVAIIGVVVWAGPDRTAKRLSTLRGDFSTASGRLQAWADTGHIIRDFDRLGTGLNTYGTAMMVYQTGDRVLHFQEAHNDYLQLMAEGGLLIGVPILLTLAIFIRDVRRRFREAPKVGTTYWLRVGAVIGLISIGLQSLVEFSLQMPGNAALFAVLAALAIHESPNLRSSTLRPLARDLDAAFHVSRKSALH